MLLSRGVIAACLFSAMCVAFRGCLATRPTGWNWPRYVSLAGAMILAAWGLASDASRIARALSLLESGLAPGLAHPMTSSGPLLLWPAF
jgi:hypothetical protein